MKFIKKIAALFCAALMLVTYLSFTVNASTTAKPATGIKLSDTRLTLGVNETRRVTTAFTPAGSTG